MHLRRRGDQSIHRTDGTSEYLAAGDDSTPAVGDSSINGQYSIPEALGQFVFQPFIQSLASLASGQAFDTVSKLR